MNAIKWIFALAISIWTTSLSAQDGQSLFKAKCNTCHLLEKAGTGPQLQGVKAKWEAAGEAELLYQWVGNSNALIASGKSKMALAIKNFSASEMPAQQVTPEEIDAILGYVDSWTPPVATTTTQVIVDPAVNTTNYAENLDLFYALLTLTVVLLLAIIIMSGTVIRLVQSDYFKDHVRKNNTGKILTLALIIGFTGLISSPSYAFKFNGPGEAAEDMPWLLIENGDLYMMIFVNLLLLGVLLYIRRMFKLFLGMTQKPQEIVAVEEGAVLKRVNKILTDVVPIEEEHTILMHHEYDGIRELDNNLPPWWVWGFYATIVFAVVYIFNYHILGTSDLQITAYNKEMAQAEKDKEAYLKSKAMNVDETNVTLMEAAGDLSTGKTIFSQNCVACHGENGEGNSGPNLTDKYWIYGYDIKEVFTTIKYGRSGGMPEHESKLNPIQLQQVGSYVLHLPEKEGLEPKGEIIEK